MFDLSFLGLVSLYLIVGAIAGMSTGFLGGGGGVITVPILIYIFTLLGYPDGASVHTAVGTSLFVIIFNAASSSLVHLKKDIIHHRILIVMVVLGVLGAVAGGTVSAMTASPIFKKLLGAFLIVTAIRFIRASGSGAKGRREALDDTGPIECPVNERQYPPKTFVLCGLIGFSSGFVASFFGIGGGAITIPLGIILVNFSMIEAICYSTCLMTVCTVVGVVVQTIAGLSASEHVPYSIGYVNYIAGISMAASGTYTARWAAGKVHTMNQVVLIRIITVVIIVAAVGMFLK
jgi:uncharacterized protein